MRGLWLALTLLVSIGATRAPANEDNPRTPLPYVVLRTTAGDLLIGLYSEAAPQNAAQFLALVRAGVYDRTRFDVLRKGFLLQDSGPASRQVPLTDEQSRLIRKIPGEFDSARHLHGRLTMFRDADDPNSATGGFGILLADASHLDGQYTVFGEVLHESSFEVLNGIAAVPVDFDNHPLIPVEVMRAFVVETQAQLDDLMLRGPIEIVVPSGLPGGPVPEAYAWGIFVVGVMSLGAFWAVRRGQPRIAAALLLTNCLIAAFLLYAGFTSSAVPDSYAAAAVFLVIVAVIKLMGSFEPRSS